MTVGINSYGTAADVAALTPRYAASGAFTTGTRPTLAQVETWIDNASATLNVMLSRVGFAIPITQASAKAACGQLIAEVVSDLAHFANSAGRFYTERALERGVAPMKVLRQDMWSWVEEMAAGLEKLGATRSQSLLEGLAYKSGNTPIFQRDGFSNSFDDIAAGEDE